LRIGIVGAGLIVDTFIQAIQLSHTIKLTALYARNEEKAIIVAKRYQIQGVFTDYEVFLKNDSFDTVYIALPNDLHFSFALEALNAGKNVIVEKPFTSNLKEAKILIEKAKLSQQFIFEAITTPFLPNYIRLKEDLDKIGKIHMAQLNFSQYSSRFDRFKNGELPNAFNLKRSGGALMDLNVYNIHFIIGLFGQPKTVNYYANKAYNGIDTSGVLTLTYDEYTCVCVGAKDSASPSFGIIQGENGYLKIDGPANVCLEYEICSNNDQYQFKSDSKFNRMSYELLDFQNIVESSDYKRCEELLKVTLQVMQVLDRARHSANIVFPADDK